MSAALTRFFSWSDAIDVIRAAAVSAALSAAIAFVIFRLDGLPRSLPLIHAMVLVIALGAGRGLSRLKSARRAEAGHAAGLARDHVLLVGATRLAWLYARLVDELPGSSRRIVGVVDERARLTGRSIGRYAVVGVPGDLDKLLAEFRVHGVEVNRLVYAIEASALSPASVATMARVCSAQGVAIESVGEQLGVPAPQPLEGADAAVAADDETDVVALLDRPFWRVKRGLDFVLAALLMVAAIPIAPVVWLLVVADIGYPAKFWQQRMGRGGAKFIVNKFRTLRAPFDKYGRSYADSERLTRLGRALRKTRLDELPQLWSILVGDMSLIGPRPLLPIDQPERLGLRLAVRPGLTGWAQVNGGKLVTPAEKLALDEWYVRNASLKLETTILLRTVSMMINGDVRGEAEIAAALEDARRHAPSSNSAGTPVPVVDDGDEEEDHPAPAVLYAEADVGLAGR